LRGGKTVIRFTKERIKDVKYVVVEAVLKRDKSNKVEGLFIGYQPMVKTHTQLVSNDEQFIWLYKGDNIYMLNASHYDIKSIEMQRFAEISTYIGTSQIEYIDRLKLIHETFTEEKKVLASGLIDADEYTVPKKIEDRLNEGEKKSEAFKTPSTGASYTPGYSARSGGCNYSTGSYYSRKEPSTTVFKRTTKYPITTAIDKMKAKVEEIRKGEYKAPGLPFIPADKEEPAKEADADKTSDDMTDYEDIYGGMM
jgi:hypothetical protein